MENRPVLLSCTCKSPEALKNYEKIVTKTSNFTVLWKAKTPRAILITLGVSRDLVTVSTVPNLNLIGPRISSQ
jgi:hypothetical protein